jgi:predicted NAD/FAD-binding protein
MKKRLAIIGSGISAMGCADRLRDEFAITIFEKNDYLGGHTHTHRLQEGGREYTVDTGFIVFNLHTYPNLIRLFGELGIEKQKCSMTFSVWNHDTGLQFGSEGLRGLFAQPGSWRSRRHWKWLLEIPRFYRLALAERETMAGSHETIKEYAERHGLSRDFLDNYLAPLSAAVWSTGQIGTSAYDFPIAIIIPFFYNHGMLRLWPPVQWYSVVGGSDTYTRRIAERGDFEVRLSEPAVSVTETAEGVRVVTEKGEYEFDAAVVASHADESVQLTPELEPAKRDLLRQYGYTPNRAVLHTDESVMPSNRRAWAAWNQSLKTMPDGRVATSTAYWMNPLQHTKSAKNHFVSINPFLPIDPAKVIKELDYSHPHFTVENFALQPELNRINGTGRIKFAGAYFRYGFHEDGLMSGLAAAESLLAAD